MLNFYTMCNKKIDKSGMGVVIKMGGFYFVINIMFFFKCWIEQTSKDYLYSEAASPVIEQSDIPPYGPPRATGSRTLVGIKLRGKRRRKKKVPSV